MCRGCWGELVPVSVCIMYFMVFSLCCFCIWGVWRVPGNINIEVIITCSTQFISCSGPHKRLPVLNPCLSQLPITFCTPRMICQSWSRLGKVLIDHDALVSYRWFIFHHFLVNLISIGLPDGFNLLLGEIGLCHGAQYPGPGRQIMWGALRQ